MPEVDTEQFERAVIFQFVIHEQPFEKVCRDLISKVCDGHTPIQITND